MRIGLIVIDDGIYTHHWIYDLIKSPKHTICACACLSPFHARNFNPGKRLIDIIAYRSSYYGMQATIKFALLFLKNTFHSLKALMKSSEIPLVSIPNHDINNQHFLDRFKQYNPQVLVTAFSQKAESPLLTLAPLGCLNIHFSYLPENAGREPVFWSMLTKKGYGLTVYRMNENYDSGEILAQTRLSTDRLSTLDEAIRNICMHIPEVLEIALHNLEREVSTKMLPPDKLNSWPKSEDVNAFYNAGFKFI